MGKSADFQIREMEKSENQATFGGERFQVIELPSVLIPLRTGRLTAPSDHFQVQYADPEHQPRRPGSMFDLLESFGGQQMQEKNPWC